MHPLIVYVMIQQVTYSSSDRYPESRIQDALQKYPIVCYDVLHSLGGHIMPNPICVLIVSMTRRDRWAWPRQPFPAVPTWIKDKGDFRP